MTRRRLQTDHRDPYRSDDSDPCRQLLVAIIRHAHREALSGGRFSADALTYIFGPNCAADCELLGLNVTYLRRRVADQLAVREAATGRFTPEAIHRLHAEYTAELITLDTLARRHATTGPTLAALFHAQGLPVRPPGRPRRPAQSAHGAAQ